jgi:hypothetical protein
MLTNLPEQLPLPAEAIIVNPDDINDASWPVLYAIRLETGTMWLTDPFIVAADSEQDALDEVADYCVEQGWLGYIALESEVYADCQHDRSEWCECESGYAPAGNGNTYIRDSGSTRIVELARRVGLSDAWCRTIPDLVF